LEDSVAEAAEAVGDSEGLAAVPSAEEERAENGEHFLQRIDPSMYHRHMKIVRLIAGTAAIMIFSAAVPLSQTQLNVQVSGPSTQLSIPQGAQRIPVLSLHLSATCAGPVSISSITVHHAGLGSASDILRLYIMDGTSRLTRGSVPTGSRPQATLRFRPSLVIPACTSRNFTVDADFAPNIAAGSEHAFTINGAADINAGKSTVTVSAMGSVPVHATPSTPVAITVTFLPILANTVLFGGDRTLARFQLLSTSDHDQLISAITLTNDGSAQNGDLQNLTLVSSSKKLLSNILPSLSVRSAPFVLDPPMRLPAHSLMLLEMHGDVVASKRYTIKIILDEPSDLQAADATGR
jgi:hypothetical protein